MTASLLKKSNKCIEEEKELVLVQKPVETCGRKQRRISFAERHHAWMGAVTKDMSLILSVISIAHK